MPSIPCIAHRTRKSSKGRDVVVTPDTGATMTIIPWALVHKLGIEINVEDNNYDLVTASGDNMTVLGTVVIYLHPEGADTRPVYGIVTDDLGDAEILLSYADMKDWGMLAEDFPKIKPMKAKKMSTPKKVSILAVKRNNPVKSPRKSRQHVAEHQLSSKEAESIQECNQKEEDQKEAEKLSKYLHDKFPDVLKEQLEKDDSTFELPEYKDTRCPSFYILQRTVG